MPPELEDKTPAITKEDLDGINTDDVETSEGDSPDLADADTAGKDEPADKRDTTDKADEGDKADKPAKKPANRSAFDLDDDDEDGSSDDPADKEADDDKDADKEKSEKSKKDGEKTDDDVATDWREAVVDKITAKLEDSMSAAKLKKQRTSIMNQLKRMKSPEDAIISGLAARQKLSEGLHKDRFPVDGTDEEKADRRKELGLPETADDYVIPNVPGHEWKPEDDARLGGFREKAHNLGLSQAEVSELVSWQVRQMHEEEEAMEETMAQGDAADREAIHDQIRVQVGVPEFKSHMKVMDRLMGQAFGDEGKRILTSARFYDPEAQRWRLLSNMPQFTDGMAELARSVFGDGPHITPDQKTSMNNRKAEIEKLRRDDNDAYYRVNPNTGKSPADELLEINQDEEKRASRFK